MTRPSLELELENHFTRFRHEAALKTILTLAIAVISPSQLLANPPDQPTEIRVQIYGFTNASPSEGSQSANHVHWHGRTVVPQRAEDDRAYGP
jgi:hypothetical protein